MEQQQLPLIEATDQAPGPDQAPPSRSPASAAGTAGPSGRRRRPAGRPPRPAPGKDWRLDEHTRAVGREGVAAARALLNRAGRAA